MRVIFSKIFHILFFALMTMRCDEVFNSGPICLLSSLPSAFDKVDEEENYIENSPTKGGSFCAENVAPPPNRVLYQPPFPSQFPPRCKEKQPKSPHIVRITLFCSIYSAASFYAISIKINEANWNAMWIVKSRTANVANLYFSIKRKMIEQEQEMFKMFLIGQGAVHSSRLRLIVIFQLFYKKLMMMMTKISFFSTPDSIRISLSFSHDSKSSIHLACVFFFPSSHHLNVHELSTVAIWHSLWQVIEIRRSSWTWITRSQPASFVHNVEQIIIRS